MPSRSAHPFAFLRVISAAAIQAALAARLDSPATSVTLDRLLEALMVLARTPSLSVCLVHGLTALAEDWAIASSCWTSKAPRPVLTTSPVPTPMSAASPLSEQLPDPLFLLEQGLRYEDGPVGLVQAAGPAIMRALLAGPQTATVASLVRWISDAIGPVASMAGEGLRVSCAAPWDPRVER